MLVQVMNVLNQPAKVVVKWKAYVLMENAVLIAKQVRYTIIKLYKMDRLQLFKHVKARI